MFLVAFCLHAGETTSVEMKIIIFLFIALVIRADARLFEGQCRDRPAPVISPFNYKLYLGEWYEVGNAEIR